MAYLKGNLHTHTTRSDGSLEAPVVVERYRALGYDFLAFTDHRLFLGPEGHHAYWASLPQAPDLIVLRGVEEESEALNGQHIGFVRGVEEELRIVNHPNVYMMSVEEVLQAIELVGAHAVEVTHHGRYLERYDTDRIPVPKVATDDMHEADEIGVSWIEVSASRDPDAILRAIKAGDFRRVFGGGRG